MNHPTKAAWRKSAFCNGADACVEARIVGDVVEVRDSKLGEASPVLKFSATDWAVFVAASAAEQLGTYGGPVLLVAASLNCWEMWRDGAPWVSLSFTDAEVDAFVAGVVAGEFTPEKLAEAGDGSGVDGPGSGLASTLPGSGGGSVPA